MNTHYRTAVIWAFASALVLTLFAGWLSAPRGALADEGWEILRFEITYDIDADGTVRVVEAIDVDFRDLPSRGIVRDLLEEIDCPEADPAYPRIYECPADHKRQWRYSIVEIAYADGRPVPWETASEGDFLRARIGDPDVFLTGRQSYRVVYTIDGALDAYANSDEFFWNAILDWPVRIRDARVTVRLPELSPVTAGCWQGMPNGAEQPCPASVDTSGDAVTAHYTSLGMLEPREALTVVLEWDDRGMVDVQPPITRRPFSVHDLYTLDFLEWAGAALVAVLGFGALGRTWWQWGRDRRYTTINYLTDDATEERKPLFGAHPIVVEFTPPLDLRPGQMGLIQDQRAHMVDVSATIVDLAVRGYLKIEELPKTGWLWFGRTDWKLHRLKHDQGELLPYEARLLTGLFEKKGDEVKVSDLKQKFAARLQSVQALMYKDGVEREWLASNPGATTAKWVAIGTGVAVAGVGLAAASGYFFGRILIGAPIIVTGLLLMAISGHMPRRTAKGSEIRRRVRGFKLYIETAEKHLQEFNEEENIFARYLPYAMVFGCVDKWSKAFHSLESLERNARSSVATWYVGSRAFDMRSFNRSMSGFAGSVGSTLSSKPPSSGGSGARGGGGAGRGGGGGGGGRW